MPVYEWVCYDCSIFWDREYSLGKAPKRTKCPKCKKLCEKFIENQNVAISFKDDGAGNRGTGANDFHTVRRRYQKHAEQGFDKDSANRFLNREIKKSKEAMDDESFRYSSASIDWHKYAKAHGLNKVSEDAARKKVESAKKLTQDAYDRANKMGYKDIGKDKLDITKPNKNQP